MANPVSLQLTDHNGNTLQVTGATVLTPAERQALGIMLSQPLSAVLCDVNGNPLQLSSGSSGAWASLTGDLTETQVIPFDGGTVGTPDSGISRIGAASLAIGNGVAANTSGSLTLSSLYASLVDTVAVTLTGVFTDGVGSVGTNGQVLSSTVTGTKWVTAAASGVTSITGDGTILSNSGSTGAVTLTLENAGQNSVLAGPISGGSGAPTYRAINVADLPVITPAAGQGFWAGTGIMGTAPNTNFTATGVPGISAANAMACWLFYIDQPITVKQVTVSIAVAGASGSVVDVGLYPATASSTIVFGTNGGINGNSATRQSVGLYTWNGSAYASASSVTIQAGWYYFAYTASTVTTLTVYCTVQNSSEEPYEIMNNPSGSLSFLYMTSQATSGVLPHTLPSSLTKGTTNGNMPACWISG